MTRNLHFHTVADWPDAQALLTFEPRRPRFTAGHDRQSLQIHVRDHKQRELAPDARTLEAHYGAFVISQARPGEDEARKLALDTKYGPAPQPEQIAGHAARTYELGPEPPPDDIDGRSPAVVTWHDGPMFYLIASTALPAAELVRIARSMYDDATLARRGSRPGSRRRSSGGTRSGR
jgi:hypothetical protein